MADESTSGAAGRGAPAQVGGRTCESSSAVGHNLSTSAANRRGSLGAMRVLALSAVLLSGLAYAVATASSVAIAAPATRATSVTVPAPTPGAHVSGEAPDGVDYVIVPPSPPDNHRAAGLTRLIYLNPCRGGCAIGTKKNDAATNQSTIPKHSGTLAEFPFGEPAWSELVRCVRRAYDLYDVTITTEEPSSRTDHVEVMVAGSPEALGFSGATLGISPLASDCSPLRNVLSFVFAEAHSSSGLADLCATVVHEAGHTFGLDHALQCRDPMTYLTACGDKLFLNIDSQCGEFRKDRYCRCGAMQNSHVKLLNELGPSGRDAPPGIVELESPTEETWNGSQIFGEVRESRWVRSIELWINGFRWARLPHQSVPEFRFTAPEISDGIVELEVREVNDLGVVGVDRRTLLKGAPCESSSACRTPETCEQGKCVFPAPTGQLGQVCAAAQECASWECLEYAEQQRCAASCTLGSKNSDCPSDYTCVSTDENGTGMCWLTSELPEAGCCGASRQAPNGLAIGLVLGGLLLRRRRRSRR